MGPWAGQLLFVKQRKIGALILLDTLRTKLLTGAECYWSKEIRQPLLRSKRPPGLHLCRKVPWGSKGWRHQPIIGAVKPPLPSMLESMLAKRHALMLGSVLRIFLQCRRPRFDSWVGKIPGEGNGNPLQYSCLENPVGQRSLVGYSPWDHKESDTTEWLNFHFHFFMLGHVLEQVGCEKRIQITGQR